MLLSYKTSILNIRIFNFWYHFKTSVTVPFIVSYLDFDQTIDWGRLCYKNTSTTQHNRITSNKNEKRAKTLLRYTRLQTKPLKPILFRSLIATDYSNTHHCLISFSVTACEFYLNWNTSNKEVKSIFSFCNINQTIFNNKNNTNNRDDIHNITTKLTGGVSQ